MRVGLFYVCLFVCGDILTDVLESTCSEIDAHK